MKKLILVTAFLMPFSTFASDGPGNSNISTALLSCVVLDAKEVTIMTPPPIPVKSVGSTDLLIRMNGLILRGVYSSTEKSLNADVMFSNGMGGSGGSGRGEFPLESETIFVANHVRYTFKCNIN